MPEIGSDISGQRGAGVTGDAGKKAMRDRNVRECCPEEAAALTVAGGAIIRRARAFKALSNPTRLRILELVAHKQGIIGESELVGDCCRGQPTISHHVKVLKDAGLLECERQGLWCRYFVRKDVLRELVTLLNDLARAGQV
jgi:ArsR family transcriptional regulator